MYTIMFYTHYMHQNIMNYHDVLPTDRQAVCVALHELITENLTYTENKIWHSHPVWFIDANPIVGYDSQKKGVRLMFWSGASFDEPKLQPGTGKFKDASIIYTDVNDIIKEDVVRWLAQAEHIQWDYKNLIKRKGELVRLK